MVRDRVIKLRASDWLTTTVQPVVVYLIAGYLFAYGGFFLRPIFLSPQGVMQFPQYIPAADPIGVDFQHHRSNLGAWVLSDPFRDSTQIPYPPLGYLLPYPLLFVGPQASYMVMTAASTLGFVAITLILPLLIATSIPSGLSVIIFCFLTGLTSYGLQFELERGQFNVVAVALCLLGIYLFHHNAKLRYIAYVLFSASIQLKLYPCIFVVMLIEDWSLWQCNLRRILSLVCVNVALLFALGPSRFWEMQAILFRHMLGNNIWVGNHSVTAFAALMSRPGLVRQGLWTGVLSDAWTIQVIVLGIVVTCFLIVWISSMSRKRVGIDGALLLTCTLLALVLPSVSHDYTLALLAGPMAIYLCQIADDCEPRNHTAINLLVLVLSIAYSTTLFSYVYKPAWLGNNLPMLVIILVVVAVMTRYLPGRNVEGVILEESSGMSAA